MEEAQGPSGTHADQDYPMVWGRQAGPPGEETPTLTHEGTSEHPIYFSVTTFYRPRTALLWHPSWPLGVYFLNIFTIITVFSLTPALPQSGQGARPWWGSPPRSWCPGSPGRWWRTCTASVPWPPCHRTGQLSCYSNYGWACLPSSCKANIQQYWRPNGPTASIFYVIWIKQSGAMVFIFNLDKVSLKKLSPTMNI